MKKMTITTMPKPDYKIADDSPFTRLEKAMKAYRQARHDGEQGFGTDDEISERCRTAQKEYDDALSALNSVNKGYEAFQSPAE